MNGNVSGRKPVDSQGDVEPDLRHISGFGQTEVPRISTPTWVEPVARLKRAPTQNAPFSELNGENEASRGCDHQLGVGVFVLCTEPAHSKNGFQIQGANAVIERESFGCASMA